MTLARHINQSQRKGSSAMTKHYIAKTDLIFNGVQIHDKSDRLSLTDMWKAAGSEKSRQPSEWLASADAKRFIETLEILKPENSRFDLVKTQRGGKTPGTWAHWQIALAYAKYLSPEFHMWCNQVVRAHMEERTIAMASNLTKYDASIIGNIVKNCTGITVREELDRLLPEIISSVAEMVKPQQPVVIIQGKTSGEILKANGFEGIKGLAVWFGNRLEAFGCRVNNNGSGYLGVSRARLFDPNKTDMYLRNGGRSALHQKIAERHGQGKLRLVDGGSNG